MDHRQSDVDVIENATQRLIQGGAGWARWGVGGGIGPSVLLRRARSAVNKLRGGAPPPLMNYNAFNGGGAGERSRGDGRNLQRCQDIFMQSEKRGTPRDDGRVY